MRKARFHVSTQLTFRGATSISENWEDKFRPLANLPFHIEYRPVPFGTMFRPLVCVEEIGITVDARAKNLSQQTEAEECLREGR